MLNEIFTLPPTVLCLQPLFNYCDLVWTPTAAKLTAMLERVRSKFVTIFSSKVLLYSYRVPKVS